MSTGMATVYILIFIVSYLIGAVPWGYLIGKLYGKDIRTLGSCNVGATNVTRVIGKIPGKICFLLDLIKGFLPVLITTIMIKQQIFNDTYEIAQIIAAAAAVIGHIWPVYLKFRGGKGISTSAGAILAMAPYSFAISGVVWVLVFLVSRYVSLASVAGAAVLPVSATFLSYYKAYPLSPYLLVFLYLLAVLAIVKHTANIKRLINGTENRFEKKPKSDEAK